MAADFAGTWVTEVRCRVGCCVEEFKEDREVEVIVEGALLLLITGISLNGEVELVAMLL